MALHEIIKDIFKTHSNQYHKVGDYSATEIISPPRLVALQNRYPDDSKKISMMRSTASLIGTGVHAYIEKLMKPWASKYSLEQTLTTEICGKTLSGTYDILVNDNTLVDVKTCKTWKLIFDPEMKEWVEQQNIYAWMLKKSGINIGSLNILAIFLDWQEGMIVRSKKYPREPMQIFPLEIWPEEKTEDFIKEKLDTHLMCEGLDDDNLPPCTPEERWERFPEGVTKKFAIMKSAKAARAARVLTTKKDAIEFCKTSKNLSSESFVEIRYAQRTRCDKYCNVNSRCNHYQTYLKDIRNDTLYDRIPVDIVMQGKW